jgi:hypothetical protein
LVACAAQARAEPGAPALAALDDHWETWPPVRQARVVELLVQRVHYDAATGQAQVTFQATGLRTLAAELHRPRPEADREHAA